MRKGFLIYEEMREWVGGSHIWLCNHSSLNFLIYEENFIFFFISAGLLVGPSIAGPQGPLTPTQTIKTITITGDRGDVDSFHNITHTWKLQSKSETLASRNCEGRSFNKTVWLLVLSSYLYLFRKNFKKGTEPSHNTCTICRGLKF